MTLYATSQYKTSFDKTIASFARRRKKPFTVDDVVNKIGTPPYGDRTILGPLMSAAVRNYSLRKVHSVTRDKSAWIGTSL